MTDLLPRHLGDAAPSTPSAPSTKGSRLRQVLAAHRLVTADPSVPGMIDRLLLAAVTLTDAEYGAAVIRSAGGTVSSTTLHHPELAERAGWRAVLDAADPTPAERARRVAGRGLLGATVSAHPGPTVELYVGSTGREGFDADADELLGALLELAGTAIENAVLSDEAQRTKDWLQASAEIARALLSRTDPDLLMHVVQRALQVSDADNAALLLPRDGDRLVVAVSAGVGRVDFEGSVVDGAESALGRAVLHGESVLVGDLDEVIRPGWDNVHDLGPLMATPLVDVQGVRGSVLLTRRRGRLPFTVRDLDLATTFADQLALALEMDDARLRSEWTKVLEDRHRIAQDLHDNVMQRLFATGVGLQSLAGGTLPVDAARRLGRYVADLDETIDEIRTRVFGLRDANGLAYGPADSRFPRVDGSKVG